jgi:hypothetical protein
MNVKKTIAAVTIAGALSFSALGLGAGVADAKPHPPHPPGPGWEDWGDQGNWGPGWYGPGYWGPGWACVSATGPWGYVTGTACI